MKSPEAAVESKPSDAPLDLDRYATLSAEIDAGAPQKALLEREAVAPELWARSQAHWLKRMAAEVEQRRFPVTTKYQAIFKAKRSLAEAKLRATRDARPKPAEPPLGPITAAADELAKPIEAPLTTVDAPRPPLVAPPPREAPPAPITAIPPAPITVVPAPITAVPPPMVGEPSTLMMPSPIGPGPMQSPVAAPPPASARSPVGPPAIVPPPLGPPAGAPPAFVAPPPRQAAASPASDDEGLSRTGIVDVRELLKKHVMPFQADAAHAPSVDDDDDDDERGRTGIIDAKSLLGARAMPFAANAAPNETTGRHGTDRPPESIGRPPESVARPPESIGRPPESKGRHGTDRPPESMPRHGTAPPPAKPDLGATLMQPFDPSILERKALPFQHDGARTPSSPGMPAVRNPSSSASPNESRTLTIAAFASLTAELAERPAEADAIRQKYGVSEADHQEISRTFTHAFHQDDELRQRYVAMVRQYRGYLQTAKR